MKKFTNISGSKVGQEPIEIKLSNEELELSQFKKSIMKLMDDFLSIRSYGSARPEIMIPTKIVGKEMFVEALTDLISDKSSKDLVKSLESLKSTNKDWKSIEEKIDSIKKNNTDIKEENKIIQILEKWGSDEGTLINYLDNHISKLSEDKLLEKYKIVENMIQKNKNPMLEVISKSYFNKYNQIKNNI